MDGILTAHVADAIMALTGNDDYDATASEAADLLRKNADLRSMAVEYEHGRITRGALRYSVSVAQRQGH